MDVRIPKGDVPTLILAVLAREPNHGYGIARQIRERSGELLSLGEGSLYPPLRLLEQDKAVKADWATPEKGPARKVYTVTATGRKRLAEARDEWRAYADFMNHVLADA